MSNPARVKTTATYPGAEALKARITFAFVSMKLVAFPCIIT